MKLRGGLTLMSCGAPGTGKSWLLGSIAEIEEVEKVLLLAPKPREANSYNYRKFANKIDAEVFRDSKWAPAIDSYSSGAFTDLFRRILDLYEDETYDAIILDPFTDVTYLAAHELLEPEKAATPRDLRDSIGFYGALKYKLKDFTQSLTGLASPSLVRPKHVLVSVHLQPTKEEDMKGKKTTEGDAKGVEFLGEALPMIEGGYRREIAGEFDIVAFSTVRHGTAREGTKMIRTTEYVVQLNADPERHAKAAIVPRLSEKDVPNEMREIFRVIEEASG